MDMEQFSFMPDWKSGVEHWVQGYEGYSAVDVPQKIEQQPYGTLLMGFMDMDTAPLTEIREITGYFMNIKDLQSCKDAYLKDIALLMELQVALPMVLYTFSTAVRSFVDIFKDVDEKELPRMKSWADDINDKCGLVLIRHQVLMEEIQKGSFLRVDNGKFSIKARLYDMEELHRDTLLASQSKSSCLLMENEDGSSSLRFFHEPGSELSSFLTVMLADILNNNLELKLCEHCGKPFISGGKAIYCTRPADDKGGSCRTVGSVAKFHQAMADNPIIGEHRKSYKKYYGRMLKGQMTKAEFEAWRDEAKAKLELAKNGKLTEDNFLQWLKD